jgi:hypothetical protein
MACGSVDRRPVSARAGQDQKKGKPRFARGLNKIINFKKKCIDTEFVFLKDSQVFLLNKYSFKSIQKDQIGLKELIAKNHIKHL